MRKRVQQICCDKLQTIFDKTSCPSTVLKGWIFWDTIWKNEKNILFSHWIFVKYQLILDWKNAKYVL
jgi:hypothetical protein